MRLRFKAIAGPNLPLLNPRDCVKAVAAAYERGAAAINTVEGFLRQIVI